MLLKLIKAISAGSVAYFLIGYFVFNLLLGSFSKRHTTSIAGFKKEDGWQGMLWIFLSCVAYAMLMSLILIRWQEEQRIIDGMFKGAIIGTLIACMANFYWYGTSNFFNSLLPVLADVAAAAVTVGTMGAVIVWAGRK